LTPIRAGDPAPLSRQSDLLDQPCSLAVHAFPNEHWRRIRTNNPLERIRGVI
jgi:hypothetical protein